jgi:hypothetical protein
MTAKLQVVRAEDGFDLPRLGVEDGTAYGYFDRWNVGMSPDGKYVTDLADWEARDMHEMLTKDYRAQQIEKVLTLPITAAEYQIISGGTGGEKEARWLNDYWNADSFAGGCRTSLDQIIGLCTSAFLYKRAYFEKVWAKGTGDFAGKTVYEDLAWRPQTTCRIMRDPIHGRFRGFEQEAYYVGPGIKSGKKWPIQVKPERAFVYTHGTRRDPLNGTSDMEVAFWAWKTKQKVLMLWFQFLQAVSLPRITVKATDTETARAVAAEIAKMKSSGVLPIGVPGNPQSVEIGTLDVSGKGAEQFMQAVNWLDTAATDSVLAGFLNLTGSANMSHFGGSYALSKDASDFFLQSLEAKVREMEDQIRRQVFAPLIRHNFGPKAIVPKLQFEPLNDIDKATAVELLKQAMSAPPGGPVPTGFIANLAGQVANYLGMDGEEAKQSFKESFDAAAAQAQAKAATDAGGLGQPGGGTPQGQAVAGLAGAVNAAHAAIKAGVAPGKAHADAKKAFGGDQKQASGAAKQQSAASNLHLKHAKNAVKAKTGGAVSLSNEDTDLSKLTKAERDALPSSAFVFPSDRRYPIHDKGHAHAALKDSAGTKDEATVRAAVKARYGWDLSNEDTDLAGFNPAEPRTAGGTWGAQDSGQAGKKKPNHEQMLKERAALQAEKARLLSLVHRLQPKAGTHAGQSGVHRGQAGTHKGPKTSAPKSGPQSGSPAAKGTAPAHPSLAQQITALKHEVEHLKREVVTLQQARAKRAAKGKP